jgi:hypothetical protein
MSGSDVLTCLSKKLDSLHSLHIVNGGAVRTIKYSGHIKIPTVHNDYHSSKTNAGYSRNKFGGIYPKWMLYLSSIMITIFKNLYKMTTKNTKFVSYKPGPP